MEPKQKIAVTIRWMIRRDMPAILRIEHESFDCNWTEEEFLECLRQRNCIGMVAEHENRVVGYVIYELHKTRLHILNFAVASAYRRLSVGSQIIEKLINKLSTQRRQEIVLEVRESNLGAQRFYAAQGFRAVEVLRDHYPDTDDDAYVMRYSLSADDEFTSAPSVNRCFGPRKPI